MKGDVVEVGRVEGASADDGKVRVVAGGIAV
jgi:hypothetical protein